jgi:hypothetical protein
MSVYEFSIVLHADGSVHSGADADIQIYGEPYHKNEDVLMSDYQSNSLQDFTVQEALESCGSYVLADFIENHSPRLITAPGYAGGYYYSDDDHIYIATKLSNLLQLIPDAKIRVDDLWVQYYIEHGLQSLPPRITPFAEIYRLPPGSVVEFDGGELQRADYLFEKRVLSNAAPDFKTAIHKAAEALSDEDITMMFSGGRDSLALFLALNHMQTDGSLRLVTVDWRPGSQAQGPFQALPVADSLGLELDVLSFSDGWITTQEPVYSNIQQALSQDFTKPIAPHHALSAKELSADTIIAHGQNMDAITGIGMNRRQKPLRELMNDADTTRKILHLGNYFLYFLNNIQYTDAYMSNNLYRRGYLMFVPIFYRLIERKWPLLDSDLGDTETTIDPSRKRLLENIIRKQTPNTGPDQWSDLFQEEITRERDLVDIHSIHHEAKNLKYKTYSHSSNKLVGGLPVGAGMQGCSLMAMWGPISSYFHSQSLGIRDALQPKRMIDEYIEEMTGESYSALRFKENEQKRAKDRLSVSDYKDKRRSPILSKNLDQLRFHKTTLSDISSDSPVHDELRGHFDNITSFIENEKAGVCVYPEDAIAGTA